MTIKELVGSNMVRLQPSCGDHAYAWYHGQKFSGKLMCLYNDDSKPVPFSIEWEQHQDGQPHEDNILYVGSDDESCVFDTDEMAWRVIANLD